LTVHEDECGALWGGLCEWSGTFCFCDSEPLGSDCDRGSVALTFFCD
jgi:hypothetical protein